MCEFRFKAVALLSLAENVISDHHTFVSNQLQSSLVQQTREIIDVDLQAGRSRQNVASKFLPHPLQSILNSERLQLS